MKDYFAHAASLLRLQKFQSPPISTLVDPKDSSRVVSDPMELATTLTDHFRPLFEVQDPDRNNNITTASSINPFSASELLGAIQIVKLDKAVSNDYISDLLLKRIREAEEPLETPAFKFLHNALNEVLSQPDLSELPACISTSRMIFLNKDPTNQFPKVEDLRPIAISSIFVKVIEAVILQRMIHRFKVVSQLCKSQIGFIQRLETSMHLVRSVGYLLDNPDHYVVFIDFKSAYDRVSHSKLFSKLTRFGLDEETLSLIKLIFNSAKVHLFGELENDQRTPIRITRGTPQGSLISPLLFNIYLDDLLVTLEESKTSASAFADDLMYLASSEVVVEKVLGVIVDWAEANDMEINWKKTKVMKLLPKSSPVKVDASRKLFNGKLSFTSEYKYLGIVFDHRMTMNQFMNQIEGRITTFLMNIPRLQIEVMSVRSRRHLWKTYADSMLSYGSGILALQPSALGKYLEKYNKSLKIALGLKLCTNNEKLYWATGIWPPELRVKYNFLRTLFKIVRWHGADFIETLPSTVRKVWKTLLEEFVINDGDFSTPKLLKHFRCIFKKKTYDDPNIEVYKFQPQNWSDFYLLKLWTSQILDLPKYANRSKRHEVSDSDCPVCKGPYQMEGSYQHLLDSCRLNENLRCQTLEEIRKLIGPINRRNSLSQLAFDIRTNRMKMEEKLLHSVVGIIGKFVENCHKQLIAYLDRNCMKRVK